jgi:hypothetical protein
LLSVLESVLSAHVNRTRVVSVVVITITTTIVW